MIKLYTLTLLKLGLFTWDELRVLPSTANNEKQMLHSSIKAVYNSGNEVDKFFITGIADVGVMDSQTIQDPEWLLLTEGKTAEDIQKKKEMEWANCCWQCWLVL